MALYNYTRIQLRHLTARLCNDLILGTVAASPAPAPGTFSCAETDWEKPDGYFDDWIEVYCYQGTGVGTSGNPTAWLNSTHTLTFKPAATLTAGDKVEMHQRFTVATYNDFINMAIEMVAKEALLNKVDVTTVLVADTYSYTIPIQFLYITELEVESDIAGVYAGSLVVERHAYKLVNGKIEFKKSLWVPIADRKLRITGLASPSILDTDTEECPISPMFLAYQSAALLHQSLIRGSGVDSEMHSTQMTLCQTMADKVRNTMQVSIGNAISVVED